MSQAVLMEQNNRVIYSAYVIVKQMSQSCKTKKKIKKIMEQNKKSPVKKVRNKAGLKKSLEKSPDKKSCKKNK
jgi:hypothetical protein